MYMCTGEHFLNLFVSFHSSSSVPELGGQMNRWMASFHNLTLLGGPYSNECATVLEVCLQL